MDTKVKLLYATMESIKKDGINGFTIRNVANQCDISSTAIYKHYKNKSDLLKATIDYIISEWCTGADSIISKTGTNYPSSISKLSSYTIEFLCENELYLPVIVSVIYDNYNYICYDSKISHYFRALLSKWVIHEGISHEKATKSSFLLNSIIITSILSIYNKRYEYNEKTILTIEEYIRQIFET